MIAMFMMFAMILGLNTVAFAAEGTNTVHVNTGAYDVSNVTFNAYRVFDVTKSGANYGYVMTAKFVEFFNNNSCTTDDAAYKYVDKNQGTIADNLKKYITDNGIQADVSVKAAEGRTTFSNLADGYYIIVPSGDTFSPNLVTVAETETKTVNLKGKEPTAEKKVENQDWASAQVGKKVTFKVTSQVPDMTGKSEYHFKLKDKLSKGLTMTAADFVSVTIGNETLGKDKYEVKLTSNNQDGTTELEVTIKEFINYSEKAGENIVFEYQAEVNKDAVTVDKATNTAQVGFGNKSDELTFSKPDTVKVYTHTLTITKVDWKDQTPLAGAEFELYEGTSVQEGKIIKLVDVGKGVYHVPDTTELTTTTTVVSPTTGIITIKGLKEGTYTLKETKAPDGYNKGKDTEITITAESNDGGETVTVTGNTITVENNSGLQLPSTGGMGTIIFVAAGVCVVGFLIFTSRKTKRTK